MLLEILILVFLTRRIGYLAIKKGLVPLPWKIYTVLSWIGVGVLGGVMALLLFGDSNIVAVNSIAFFSSFGGYLLVRYILEKKPDNIEEDINKIGVDDLKPPSKPE